MPRQKHTRPKYGLDLIFHGIFTPRVLKKSHGILEEAKSTTSQRVFFLFHSKEIENYVMCGPKAPTEYCFYACLKGAFHDYHMRFAANIYMYVTFLPSATRPTTLQGFKIMIAKRSYLPVGGLRAIPAIISSSEWANPFAKSQEPRPQRKKH